MKSASSLLIQLFSVLLFLFCSTLAPAQDTKFLREVSENNFSLSIDEQKYLNELRADQSHEKVDLVQFGNLASLQKDGILTFTLPGNPKPIVSHTIRVEYKDENHYSYYGATSDGAGSIYIERDRNVYKGYFFIDGESYSIRSLKEELHAIMTLRKSEEFKCLTHEEKGTTKHTPIPTKSGRIDPCPNPIRVLVLYTQNALNAKGGNVNSVQNVAYDAISQFNSCIYRSNITSLAVINQANSVQFFNLVESNSQADLDYLANNAGTIRSQNNADLVVLLTNGAYGTTLGMAKGVLGTPSSDRAFAIVQINEATNSNRVFAHEVGHLFGGHHTPGASSQGAPTYAKAHLFDNWPNRKHTIVAEGGAPGSRCENFSNPNVYIGGHATGTSDNDNARRVTETHDAIRDYNPWKPNTLFAHIEGPTAGSVYNYYTWEAVMRCGGAPYSYEWRTSSDGFNYSSIRGTSETFSDQLPFPSVGSYYYIWLKTTSSDAQTADVYYSVHVDTNNPYSRISSELISSPIRWIEIRELGVSDNILDSNEKLSVFPNPTINELRIRVRKDKNLTVGNASIEILDMQGRLFREISSLKLDTNVLSEYETTVLGFTPGSYIIRYKEEGKQYSKKIVVASNE